MNNSITYVLGAGASYHSMPLVQSFGERFELFLDMLRQLGANSELVTDAIAFGEQVRSLTKQVSKP